MKCTWNWIAAAATLLLGAPAIAQTSMTVETPALKRTSIEINPASALVSAVPGIGAVSGSVEGYIDDKWAGFVEFGYADADIDERWSTTVEDETNDPAVTQANAFAAGVGLRYYEDPIGDSLYGSGLVSYSESRADWEYEGEALASELYNITSSLAVGYRWVWQNGVLARLGAGAGVPITAGENISRADESDTIEEARTKIADLQDQQIIAKVDLGLGYTF